MTKIRSAVLSFSLFLPLIVGCGLIEKGTHNAGKNCMWPGCHGYQAPPWKYAGTVYASADRSTPAKGVTVTITDSAGELRLKTNSAGNFYTLNGFPAEGYRASVIDGDRMLTMKAGQTSGACNSCHAPNGQAPPLNID
jgi:hypothetical protein